VIFDRLVKSSPASTTILDPNQLAAIIYGTNRTGSGVVVTPMRAMQHAAVFSCVRVLAESAGQLPMHLLKLGDDFKSRTRAVDHPLYDVLHAAPNAFMTAQEFVELQVVHLALRGNFYAYKNVVRGDVRELLPFNPAAVAPKLTEDGGDVVYEVQYPNGKTDVLDSSEVYHVKLFSLDGVIGLSPINQNREAIGHGIAAEQHGARLFSNGAVPGGVLSTPQVLKKDSHQRIKDSWNEIHQGVDNAHKVAILEAGVQWTKTGLTAEEAQFLETRKFSRSEIAGIFRVPPHKIGDLERSTNNNIEHQELEFYQGGLVPYLTRIEARVRFSLLKPSDRAHYFAKFMVNGLLRADMASRSRWYDSMVRNGAMSPNEIREFEDMNPRDGGDIYLTPSNMSINGEPVGQSQNPDPAADHATEKAMAALAADLERKAGEGRARKAEAERVEVERRRTEERDADQRRSESLVQAVATGLSDGMGKIAEALRSRPAPKITFERDQNGALKSATGA
jgi:HK97 family phage portal protein